MNLNELTSLYDFTGRTAIVTGGTGVLAREMVRTLAGCHANVVVLGRNQGLAHKLVEEISTDSKGLVIYAYGDVLKVETLQQASEKTMWGIDLIILQPRLTQRDSGCVSLAEFSSGSGAEKAPDVPAPIQ